ncbi:MAG: winged helix-turn-helix domain-containing protein [Gammaproteobacteria bacterium]|nr:winged helix-turn-helix domain-containing protein [Gammaproteobacteria bacterium]
MLWILLGSMGMHAHVHMLPAAIWAQMRAKLPNHSPSPHCPRVLLVVNARTNNDRPAISVKVALECADAQVHTVTERAEAEQWVRHWDPEVLVLLGWSAATGAWLRRLQLAAHQDALSFLVVGDGAQEDRERMDAVAALEAGAQAYVPSSMGPEPLTAQVRNMLKNCRRTRHPDAREGKMETLCIDLVSLRVWILGQEMHMPRQLFYLFHHFALHPDEVVSNHQIADLLSEGKGAYLAPNTQIVKIYRLRKILESAGAKDWLETVPGFGYRFSLPENVHVVTKKSPQ